jgi:GTP-binding protein
VPLDDPEPQVNFDRLRREVSLYSKRLADRPHVVVLSKRDLLAAGDEVPTLIAPGALAVLSISSAAGAGVEELKEQLWRVVQDVRLGEQVPDDGPGSSTKERSDDDWELDWGETDSGVD